MILSYPKPASQSQLSSLYSVFLSVSKPDTFQLNQQAVSVSTIATPPKSGMGGGGGGGGTNFFLEKWIAKTTMS